MLFFNVCTLFSSPRGSFLAIPAAGHAGGPHVHYGASLNPGRAPWCVLWAFKSGNLARKHGVALRRATSRARQEMENAHTRQLLFAPLLKGSNTVTTIASSFPRSYRYYVCVCGPLLRVCDRDVCVYALCVLHVRVCMCTGLSTCDAC